MEIEKLTNHMMQGVIFHSQLSEYYRFLNLSKYADFHSCQAQEEMKSFLDFIEWYLITYGKLIPESTSLAIENIIPKDWYSHISQDIDKATVRDGVKNGLVLWINWEVKTQSLYEEQIKASNTETEKIELRKRLKDVNKEIEQARHEYINLKSCDFDISVIIEKLH